MRGVRLNYTEILYSLIISPAFLLTDNTEISHTIIMWFNAALMSSAVYPIYFTARTFLNKQSHIWFIVAYGLLIGEMNYTMQTMQENLNYPLMMWFFLAIVHVFVEGKGKPNYIVGIGALAFALSICKQMNLGCVIAVILYLLVQILVQPRLWRRTLKQAILFGASFLGFKAIYMLIMKQFLTGPSMVGSLTETILNALDINVAKQLIYPVLVYLVYTVLATGIIPIPVLTASMRKMNGKHKQFLIFLFCYLITYIGVICIIITQNENLGDLSIRFHSRYFFYAFIPIQILFLCFYEKYQNINIKSAMICIGGWIVLLTILTSTDKRSFVDSVSTLFLRFFSGSDMLLAVEKCVLALVAIICMYFLCIRGMKEIYVLNFLILGVMSIGATYYYSFDVYHSHSWTKADDALVLNEHFSSEDEGWNSGEQILVLQTGGSSEMRTFVLESYLNEPYHLARYQYLNVGEEIAFGALPFYSYNIGEWTEPDMNAPKYIISPTKLHMQGYKELDLGMEMYKLYQRTGGVVKLNYAESGIYEDRWIGNEPANLSISGTVGYTAATLRFSADNTILGTDVTVAYTDDSGYADNFVVPQTEVRTGIELPVYKGSDETSYSISITPDSAVQPGNGNERFLSFRLFDPEIIYEESGIYDDRWIGDECASLRLLGADGCTAATLKIVVDNVLVGTDITTTYSDETGYADEFYVPPTAEHLEIYFPVFKSANETFYTVTLEPDRSVQPDNGDTRMLSFRLYSAEIIDEQ